MPLVGTPAYAKTKINVGALRFTSHAASFVAFERGYFADAGLDVEFKFFQAAQPMAVAIASGDVDYAVTAISGGLISLAQKGAIKVIGGALSEEDGIDGQKILASDAAFQAGLTGLHPRHMRLLQPQLGRIFDGDHPLVARDQRGERVQQRRFTAS